MQQDEHEEKAVMTLMVMMRMTSAAPLPSEIATSVLRG